jgi:hypothetical protein
MRSPELKSSDIDQIGRKVLKAVRVQDMDIARIIGTEDLFEPVRAAMADRPTVGKNSLGILVGAFLRHWRTASALTSLAIIALGAFYFVRQTPTEIGSVPAIEFPTANAEIDSSDLAVVQTELKPSQPVRKHIVRRRPQPEAEDVGEFQALTYTGDDSDTTDGQIVRVELPRSSLFAMGVDVPVENQTNNKVKADLLIGDDGVMRAVRIVGQGDLK